jgi:ABC-type transporter Mla subunit MlaD
MRVVSIVLIVFAFGFVAAAATGVFGPRATATYTLASDR